MGLQFQYKEFLLLLSVLLVFLALYILLLNWKKRVIKRIGEKHLVMRLISNYSPKLFFIKFILILFAFAFGVIAVANLRKPGESDNITRKGIDVVIALDVSKSMLATDLSPNRLERAKQFILKLMDKMPNDRFGIVLFAGRAYMQMPLTTDHNAASMLISTASPDAVPYQGTVFGEALQMSARVFVAKGRRFKTVILISDGEDWDENTPKVLDEIVQQGIMVCTVGIGSPGGSQIPDPATGDYKKDANGNIVISKLNEEGLKLIAKKTNGVYVNLQSTEQVVNTLLQQLSQVEKKTPPDTSLLNYKTFYMWFAAAMFLLLIVEVFVPERRPA
jgi:Ca-activated chloride channel homolog